MANICMAVHDTEENDRSKYTKETLRSLCDTVDWLRERNPHTLWVIDNNSCQETKVFLKEIRSKLNFRVITLDKNTGTANAINLGIKKRKYNQVCVKMDNDIVVHQQGWLEEFEQVFIDNPEIGICGLKRDDVYGSFTESGKLLMSEDIMGTCTAFNPKLLDDVGYLNQFSVYGYDDVLMSARSLAAGFKNCFLPHIKITHLDNGGTEYTEWKKREAGLYLNEVSNLINMYKTGKLSPYYDGGFDEN